MMRLGYKHEKSQDLIGDRYWNNTIYPLLANGSLEHTINGTYQYPNRIGLYPGLNCQYFCTFCGRNYNAKYEKNIAEKGFEVFKKIIDQDPRTGAWEDRFRISGGLEPLTNPYIGDIIAYGTSRGFKMQMYTNGYALSSNFLEKQQGILDLEVLRISMYGYDTESYHKVTKNSKAFDTVIANIKNLCQKEYKTQARLGINYIILPGHSRDLVPLFKLISEINKDALLPVSFVTIREDFSQSNNYISDEERIKLKKIFLEIESMCDVHIDYGYALFPVRHDVPAGPLKMSTHEQMNLHGFPQIATSIDSLGNLYIYHETGFIDRPGTDRYIIGNVQNNSIENIVKNHLDGPGIKPKPFDVGFLDAFDHTITLLLHEVNSYKKQNLNWRMELEKKWKRQ
jgi:dTDP-4-amino-4,6-dideoxy-D-glucose ammonia-lyase